MMKYSLFLLIACMAFASCEKEFSLENSAPQIPVDPPKELTRKFQLKAFYSDIPIDFVETDDEVKSETDLWGYVREYIKDDIDEFSTDSTLVLIHQNDIKMPGNNDPILHKYYFIGTDAEGRYMNFLGPDYEPLRYRLHEINDDYFIISVEWKHGSTIYSRFEHVE